MNYLLPEKSSIGIEKQFERIFEPIVFFFIIEK